MAGKATGIIFVEQTVLVQFSEVQRATQLDANKQVLLLVQLYNCVKSFEVHIKCPEVTPEQTVIKDFFTKLSAFITSPQEDDSNDATVVMPKSEPLDDDMSDNNGLEYLQDDDAVSTIPKTEPLNNDLLDNDCPEPNEELPEDYILEKSEVKDELSTRSVLGSFPSTISHLISDSADPEFTLVSGLNKKSRKRKGKSSTVSSNTSAVISELVGTSTYNLEDSESGENDVVLKKKKVHEKTNTIVRRSSRHARTPVKLNSEEFVGVLYGRSTSVKQSATSPPKQMKMSPAQKATPKTERISTPTIQQKAAPKSQQKAPIKPVRQVTPIMASSGKKDTPNSLKHSSVLMAKQDATISPEQTTVSSGQQAVQKTSKLKSQKHAAEIPMEKNALESVEKAAGTSLAAREPVQMLTEITTTEISKADLFEEENKDNSIEESENSHSADLQYLCAICNLQFGEIGQYVDHIVHHPETKHELDCVDCEMHFKTKSALIQHRRIHRPKSVSEFTCSTCGRTFLKKKYLKSHMLRHIGEKNILCDLCPATFYEKKGLYVHYNRVHLGKRMEPKFFCSLCSFHSYRQRDIDRHSVVHSKTKNYVCDICGARLAHFTSLAIHKRLHSGTKRFRCSTCAKEFSQKISLQNHERIHSGERPFKCDLCQRGFQTASHLSRHKITHSQELLFQCKYCSRRFARPFQLKKHVKETHTELTLQTSPVQYESVEIEDNSEQVSLQGEPVSDSEVQYESVVIEYME